MDHDVINSQSNNKTKVKETLESLNNEIKNSRANLKSPYIKVKDSHIDIGDDAHENLSLNWTNAKNVIKILWWCFGNIIFIYLSQYICYISFADIYSTKIKSLAEANLEMNENSIFIENSFVVFSFCHQFGSFIGRCSIYLVKIEKIGYFSLLQICNVIFGFTNAYFLY